MSVTLTVAGSTTSTVSIAREQALLGVGRIVGAGAVEREFHVLGVEVRAVVELYAGVQLERIDLAVLGDRPAFGERRQHLAARADAGQPLEHIGVEHLVDRGRRARTSGRDAAASSGMPSTRGSVRAAIAAVLESERHDGCRAATDFQGAHGSSLPFREAARIRSANCEDRVNRHLSRVRGGETKWVFDSIG